MCGITILAYCCWNIIRTRVASAYRKNFGELHGNIFGDFVQSSAWRANFSKAPVICLSVSSKDVYHRTGNEHPVLGIEYAQEGVSLTERLFQQNGSAGTLFYAKNSVAPLAFYFTGDLLSDYTSPGTDRHPSARWRRFRKIYRPEIYNRQLSAGQYYQPNLQPPWIIH